MNMSQDNSGSDIEIRVITKSAVNSIPNIPFSIYSHPFNVYNDHAVSVSILRNFSAQQPVPHIEICLDRDVMNEYAAIFDLLYNAAGNQRSDIFENEKWDDFGDGSLVKKMV